MLSKLFQNLPTETIFEREEIGRLRTTDWSLVASDERTNRPPGRLVGETAATVKSGGNTDTERQQTSPTTCMHWTLATWACGASQIICIQRHTHFENRKLAHMARYVQGARRKRYSKPSVHVVHSKNHNAHALCKSVRFFFCI